MLSFDSSTAPDGIKLQLNQLVISLILLLADINCGGICILHFNAYTIEMRKSKEWWDNAIQRLIWFPVENHADTQSSLIFLQCAGASSGSTLAVISDIPSALSICLYDPLLNQTGHLWTHTMGRIVSVWKESMCFANAALAAANLRDNLYIQPLIKEHS